MTNTKRPANTDAVTLNLWTALTAMYDYFNATLFGGELMPVVLNFSRHANSYGFFAPERWVSGETTTHEISLNPAYLMTRELRATASTLVHEMAHLQRAQTGIPCRGGYHDKLWAEMMDAVGLTPTSTGREGGARVGYKVTHMIVDGGRFDVAFAAMPEACRLPWLCVEGRATAGVAPGAPGAVAGPGGVTKVKPASKVKFTCGGCKANCWGKPSLRLTCTDCDLPMVAEGGAAVAPKAKRSDVEVDRAILAAAAEHVAATLAAAGRDVDAVPVAEIAEMLYRALDLPAVIIAGMTGPVVCSAAGESIARRALAAIEARA